MAYQPFDRNPSGIVFFGTSASDQLYESNSNFTYDGSTLNVPNITIANGGNIGSVGDPDAIAIDSNGDVTFSQDISVAGNLTVNGTTTYVNSETVTLEDPILVLGSISGNLATSDDNKDRGIQFNWHNGTSAKTGFFGFDDSAGKFTFVPDATIAGEIVSGSAGVIVANLEGNADTATVAVDASGLTSAVTLNLGDQLSGSASFSDAGQSVTISGTLTASAITGQTVVTSAESADLLLIYDDSASALRKITRGNFVSDLGIMDQFTVSGDAGAAQTITDGNNLYIAGGSGLLTTASATDTITIDVKTTNGIEISSDAVGLASSVAGNGLAYSAGVLSVGVDDSTIEINTDQLRVKALGIDTAQLAADAVDGTKIADDSVDSEHIASGAIDNEHYSTGSITENKLDRTIETTSSSKEADKDITLVDATSGSVTITLPEDGGTGWAGDNTRSRIMVVKRIDNSANDVIVSRKTADTIDGATSVQLYHRYETMTFASDGANWHII